MTIAKKEKKISSKVITCEKMPGYVNKRGKGRGSRAGKFKKETDQIDGRK